MTKVRPPIKVHGGKYSITNWIVENLPEDYEDLTYCEPFCAGASVLLNKNPSCDEVINDIDSGITSIFKALRDEPQEFINRIKRTRYTERAFKMAQNRSEKPFDDYVDNAINEYVMRRMSRGGLKRTFATKGVELDTANWESNVSSLPLIAERIENINIFNKSFIDVMKVWDEENTIFYLDPPALQSTRSQNSSQENDLSVEDHMNMLQLAKNARGKVMISGFASPLYNRSLKEWKCKKKEAVAKEKRVECIWTNY